MRIGFLLPSILTSKKYLEGRIFAPLSIAKFIVDGLVDKGHQVFFYTSKDVETKAKIVPGDYQLTDTNPAYFQFRYREPEERKYATAEIIKRDFEYHLTMKAYQDALAGKLDIIQSFHDFGAHYFEELTHFPTVYVIHDPLPQDSSTVEYLRLKKFTNHRYISISQSQRKSIIKLNFVKNIYHGINLNDYKFSNQSKDNLIYFGRILEDKGPDIAIAVAKKMKKKIIIATSAVMANISKKYYDEKIAVNIDNDQVKLQGYLLGEEKTNFIQQGKAFVFPLCWEEPFGLVMIEAMACGTPVIAYARGSAPEIIKDGQTGFLVNSSPDNIRGNFIIKKTGFEGLCEAVEKIYSLGDDEYQKMRKNCRSHVEDNFSVKHMIDQYETTYKEILNLKK